MTPADVETIKTETGASAMLSLQTQECLAHFGVAYTVLKKYGKRVGIDMVRSPMRDFDLPDQRRNLADAVRALHALLAADHRVYVHCTAGMGRAPLTVLGYLTFVERLPLDEALALIKGTRTVATPSLEAYFGCQEDLITQHRPQIEERARSLFEQRRVTRRDGDADHDWYQAEREVLSDALTLGL